MVFARLYCGGPLLGVVLAVARECEPPSFDVCLPCDVCILGGFSGCFAGFFWLVLVFFRPGAVRALIIGLNKVYIAFLLETSFRSIYSYGISNSLTIYSWTSKNKYPMSLFLGLRVVYIVYTYPSSYI